MLEFDVKKIVFSSTAATYGAPNYTPIDEKHTQAPINPYGNSKLMVEKIMDDYDKAYDARNQTMLEQHLKILDLQETLKKHL